MRSGGREREAVAERYRRAGLEPGRFDHPRGAGEIEREHTAQGGQRVVSDKPSVIV